MRSNLGAFVAQSITGAMYEGLNNLSRQGRLGAVLGRLGSIPVTLIDYALEMLKEPIMIIESIIFIAVNLIGSSFSNKKCSLSDAGWHAKVIMLLPDRLLTKTVRLIPRLFINLFNNQIAYTLGGIEISSKYWILYYKDGEGENIRIL